MPGMCSRTELLLLAIQNPVVLVSEAEGLSVGHPTCI